MKPITALRIAVVVQIGCVVLTLAGAAVFESMLPPQLLAWKESDVAAISKVHAAKGLVTILLFLAANLVGWIGLLARQRWSAWLFAMTIPLGLIGVIQTGCEVSTVPEIILDGLISMTTGAVLALAFFTDALAQPTSGTQAGVSAVDAPPPLPR